jgi:hypothetical protein
MILPKSAGKLNSKKSFGILNDWRNPVDVCFGLLLSNRQSVIDTLERYQKKFTWQGIEYPQEPIYYLFGKHICLVEKPLPKHKVKLLQYDYAIEDFMSLTLEGNGLDMLELEVNERNVEWNGPTFDNFLKVLLSPQDRWAVIFEWHCDQIDNIYRLDVNACISKIRENLKWEVQREGFIILKNL